jgi:hypothetical protein
LCLPLLCSLSASDSEGGTFFGHAPAWAPAATEQVAATALKRKHEKKSYEIMMD